MQKPQLKQLGETSWAGTRFVSAGDLRILDFDIECRPMAWYGGDFVTKQPTAIGWKFIDEPGHVNVAVIGESDRMTKILEEERRMLEKFVAAFNEADIVTGHFIRGFDLPTLQGALSRLNMPLLGSKLAQDTKIDLMSMSGLSKSQENLGAMYELEHPKIGMNTTKWFLGNLLVPEGIAATRERVVGDVKQHIELRSEMIARGVLAPPSLWRSQARSEPGYQA